MHQNTLSKANPYSPLRYPGGKACLTTFLINIIKANNIVGGTYYELYAGGAGAALNLLFGGIVDRIVLNDADIHIYAFWHSVLNETDNIVALIESCNISIETWHEQRNIYVNPGDCDLLTLGFATFFLNRCNRSGILTKAGPIGGFDQTGNYLINARFNKSNLIDRIRAIAALRDNITIYNVDAVRLIESLIEELNNPNAVLYLDPPYYNKGKSLYLNYYAHNDHEQLCSVLREHRNFNWLVSYDCVQQITELYNGFNQEVININYSLQQKKKMPEIFIFSDSINLPIQIAV